MGQTITRGPYLQQVTPDSIVIRWRTSTETTSRVAVGLVPGDTTIVATQSNSVNDHEVTVVGLSAATEYFYQVGTTSQFLAGGDSNHRFRTAPVIGSTDPIRVWAIGDAGTADANQAAVRDAYLNYAGTDSTSVWLFLGDNAYDDGTDDEYQSALFEVYPDLLRTTPFWSTRGNHERDLAVHYGICSNPTASEAGGVASGTENYFSFDHGNVHFICLDSQGSDRSPTGSMLSWLQADLANTLSDWIVAFWHHPPYTKGSHDSDDVGDSGGRMHDMRENALPILEAGGVDLVLSGHSHCYERSFLIDGHYQESQTFDPTTMLIDGSSGDPSTTGPYSKLPLEPNEGAIYIVMGSSGKVSGGTFDHPIMHTSEPVLGSLVLDIVGTQLTGRMLRTDGSFEDVFAIEKSPTFSQFRRGDANGNGSLALSDVIFLLQYLFVSGTNLNCIDSGDVNDDGSVALADAISLLAYLFQGSSAPNAPGTTCGTDPTPDSLSCIQYAGCP